ncbi:MAG: serpin family protein [Planctomycetaceae bacterium]|nr:serpin family protein [Planctomycetaceae bacterium]
MRRRIVLALFVVSLLGSSAGWFIWRTHAAPPPWTDDMQAVAYANNHFALDLYAQLREEKGNLFFSPYSVHTALSMTAVGARGTTREQMLKVLHMPTDENKLLAAGDLGRFYATPRRGYELSVANALWGQRGDPWRSEFLEIQKTRFGAGFQEADFAGNPDGERQRINRWVEERTHDRIKDLLSPGQIARDTRMVLTNAIFYKGRWATEFDSAKTADAPFHLADETIVKVPMMHTNAKCGLGYEPDGTTMVELPYRTGEVSMVVMMPRFPDGLPALERTLTPEKLAGWLGGLKDRAELEVSMPRFKFESQFQLSKHLQALGMTDAFAMNIADFTGMASEFKEPITAVAHKAFVEVNEEGTEAAAATAVAVGVKSGHPPGFYVNHPFLFLIRDVKRGTILFMGRVEKP